MIVWQVAFVAIPAATAVGTAGALYSALWDSDFARSFVHWMTLLAITVGTNALPPPWNALSPVQALAITLKEGTVLPALLPVTAYLAIAMGCAIVDPPACGDDPTGRTRGLNKRLIAEGTGMPVI